MKRFVIITALLGSGLWLCGCNREADLTPASAPASVPAVVSPQKAERLIAQGRLEEALEELNTLISMNPSSPDLHTLRGDVHRKQSNLTEARQDYATACNLAPNTFRPHYNLGVVCQALAEAATTNAALDELLQGAIKAYIRALMLQPKSFDANLNIGACYFLLGKLTLAENHTKKALDIKPASVRGHNNLAIIYENQSKTLEAIEAWKNSIELDPQQPVAMLNLGLCYMRLGKFKPALATFRAAARIDSSSPLPYQQMGIAYHRLGQPDEAIEAFQKAIRINPKSPGSYRGYGVVCMSQYVADPTRTDLRELGLKAWAFCLKLQPNQPDLKRLYKQFSDEKPAAMTPATQPAN